ncbi:MAG: hypothetical protein Q7U75_14575 [Desulfobacterales bacterium]|nr:hypothetical protein [Desulfobacterales bacterium]
MFFATSDNAFLGMSGNGQLQAARQVPGIRRFQPAAIARRRQSGRLQGVEDNGGGGGAAEGDRRLRFKLIGQYREVTFRGRPRQSIQTLR